jgi:hypothetical protein
MEMQRIWLFPATPTLFVPASNDIVLTIDEIVEQFE